MPENTATTNPAQSAAPSLSQPEDSTIDPKISADLAKLTEPVENSQLYSDVAKKIGESHNVLIALSSDPSVDEMAAAIGLSLYLDKLGKRATAIYSGSTPNALEFLKPEDTFESTADTLQDFVIALNKDKADHLRYKLDGDFVKIYITPYKTRISKDDLDFSYGDFNVDLVLALDVANGIDLDSALREHGRIMHDAVIINITTGNPGKFGEVEWSDKKASSVSEMIARLIYGLGSKTKLGKEEATAFLTGIVAATNRFSNAKTTPVTMKVSSRLMESGANQQLIAKNITPDTENEMFSLGVKEERVDTEEPEEASTAKDDPTKLEIKHGTEAATDEAAAAETADDSRSSDVSESSEPEDSSNSVSAPEPVESQPAVTPEESTSNPASEAPEPAAESSAVSSEPPTVAPEPATSESEATSPEADTALLDDLKAAEASLSQAGAETTPDIKERPVKIEGQPDAAPTSAEPTLPLVAESTSTSESLSQPAPEPATEASFISDKPEKVIQPLADFAEDTSADEPNKYGQMLEDALAGLNGAAPVSPEPVQAPNPAAMSAPQVVANPEINGVPEINYMPMPGESVLPPPPTPPIDMNSPISEPVSAAPIAPAGAPVEPVAPQPQAPAPTNLGPQPAMQDQVYTPQAADPSAFKIPGM